MKDLKRILPAAFILLVLCMGIVWLYHNPSDNTEKGPDHREKADQEALVGIGPYGRNISYTENIGDLSVNMKADRLFARKSTFLGFATVLKKHMVAENLAITVYDREKRIFSCRKDEVIMPYNMDVIEVENPYTVFPKNMSRVSLIRIDRIARTIVITDQNGEKQLRSSKGIPELNIP